MIALKYLKSSNYEDVILGLNYIKDWTWEELISIADDEGREGLKIRISVKGDAEKDNYLFNNGIYCHYNYAINVYRAGLGLYKHVKYIQL